jgi:hypothetical protein
MRGSSFGITALRVETLLAGCSKRFQRHSQNEVLEYWNIGILSFECIAPLFHHSSTPVFQSSASNRLR